MEPNPLAIFGLCVAGAGALVFLLWLNHWLRQPSKREAQAQAGAIEVMLSYLLGGAGGVSDYDDDVMSYEDERAPAITASSLGTDAGRTQDGQAAHKIRGEELLTLYQLMRRYNIPRDEAQAALKACNLPMSNGTWAKAAPPPPEEPPQVTPIAGRPTRAQFHDDPDLVFQPPPR